MTIKYDFVGRIENNLDGHKKLVDFFDRTKDLSFEHVILNFQKNNWFDANLSCILGATLSSMQDKLNTIHLENLSEEIKEIFRKNEFLSYFGEIDHILDGHNTTVPYMKFDKMELKGFENYLEKYLFSNSSLPSMSEGLTKKMKESILEIFMNARTHSNCKFIFSCGQLFPQEGCFNFTVVDIGTTIRRNVADFLNKPTLNSVEAIDWAVQESNTTRKGNIPGGLGLSILLSFIELNRGKIQIVSDNAYWAKIPNDYIRKELNNSFDGTIINIEFNIKDNNSYILSSEGHQKNIF